MGFIHNQTPQAISFNALVDCAPLETQGWCQAF